MSSDPETTRILRSWLDEGVTQLPDRILDAVLDQVPATPQHRAPWWPVRRSPTMNKFVTIGLGAAAVVAVLLIGSNLLGSGSQPPGGAPSASVAPSASIAPSPQASVTGEPYAVVGGTFPGEGLLEPETRYNLSVDGSPLITFAVPEPGWRSDPPGWIYHRDTGLPPGDALVWFGSGSDAPSIYTDACAHTGMQEFEASAAGYVDSKIALDGAEIVSGPSPITIDGRTGRFVAIVIPEDVGCDNAEYWIGYSEDGSISYYPAYLGGIILFWALDLADGQVYTVEVQTRPGLPAEFLDEVEQVVQSIEFE